MAESVQRRIGVAALLYAASRLFRRAPSSSAEPRNQDVRVEDTDVPSWVIGLLAGIVVGVIALTIVSLLLIYPGSTVGAPKTLENAMPEPRLQPDPLGDMRDYRARAERESHCYGWIDRNRGIVRLPIEEATRRILDRGIPDWPEAAR